MGILTTKQNENQEPSWIRYIKNRILRKKNFLALVSGQTGSGKSWSCLSMALMLDKSFNIDRVVFGLRPLMKLINSGEKFNAGTLFIWEEFQESGGNRNWQSLTNKLLNSLLSTFRHKRFILLINAPYSDFIDSQSRKLLHAEMEVTGIDYEKQKTILKPMIIQYNSRRKQFYYKYLRVKTKLGVSPITKWGLPKPPKWLVEQYEAKKEEFTTKLNKDIEKQLDELENKKKGKEKKPLTDKQQLVLDLMNKYNNIEKVAQEIGITERTAFFHIAQAQKKGYTYEKVSEKGGNSDSSMIYDDISSVDSPI